MPREEPVQEKIVQLRLYSGEKFTAPEEIPAGTLAAVTGLTQTWAGQALGAEPAGKPNLLEPVMTYRVALPAGADPAVALPKLRQLEERSLSCISCGRETRFMCRSWARCSWKSSGPW